MIKKILILLFTFILFLSLGDKVFADPPLNCSPAALTVLASGVHFVAHNCQPLVDYHVNIYGDKGGLPLKDIPVTAPLGTIDITIPLDKGSYQIILYINPDYQNPLFSQYFEIGKNEDVTCHSGNGINTAIGCIPIDSPNALIGFILRWAIGIGGGIAFLLMLAAGFQIMTSRGDPNQLKAGQELMTSAIAGLLLLIFSIVILRIIGFDILNIQNFK